MHFGLKRDINLPTTTGRKDGTHHQYLCHSRNKPRNCREFDECVISCSYTINALLTLFHKFFNMNYIHLIGKQNRAICNHIIYQFCSIKILSTVVSTTIAHLQQHYKCIISLYKESAYLNTLNASKVYLSSSALNPCHIRQTILHTNLFFVEFL